MVVEPMAGGDHERSAHLHARDIDEHAHEHLLPAASHTEAFTMDCGAAANICAKAWL